MQAVQPEAIEPNKVINLVEADYSGKPLKLSMSDLIFAWEDGLLNNAAYIYLALRLDGIGRDAEEEFDLNEFVDRWEGNERDRGKRKRLPDKDVMSVLSRLQKMGRADVQMQLTLKLDL